MVVAKGGGGAGNKLAAAAAVIGVLAVFGASKTTATNKDGTPKGAVERVSEAATNGLGEVAAGVGKGTGVSDAVGDAANKALLAGGAVATLRGAQAAATKRSANLAAAKARAAAQREALSKLKPPGGGGGGAGAPVQSSGGRTQSPDPGPAPTTTTEAPRPTAPPTPEPPKGADEETGRLPGMSQVTIAGGGRTQPPHAEPTPQPGGQLGALPVPQPTPIIG